MSSYSTSPSPPIPGIQAKNDWKDPSFFDNSIKVPVTITPKEGEPKTIYVTFNGEKEKLKKLKGDTKFLSVVERTVATAFRNNIIHKGTSLDELKPITFSAEDLSKGVFKLENIKDNPSPTTENEKKAQEYIQNKIKYAAHYEAQNLKNFLLGSLPSGGADHGNTFFDHSPSVQAIIKEKVEKMEKEAKEVREQNYLKNRGFLNFIKHLTTPLLAEDFKNLSIPSSDLPLSNDPNFSAAIDAFEKKDGTYYSKHDLEPSLDLSGIGTSENLNTLLNDSERLNTNTLLLTTKEKDLLQTHEKNERYLSNLFSLADQHEAHASVCRQLADSMQRKGLTSEPEDLKYKADAANVSAANLKALAEQLSVDLLEAAKDKAIKEGTIPYKDPKSPEKTLANAAVLLDPLYAHDVNDKLSNIEADYDAIKRHSAASPTPSLDTLKSTLTKGSHAALNEKTKKYKDELATNLSCLYQQLSLCTKTENKEIEKQIDATYRKLQSVTAASLKLDALIAYFNPSKMKNVSEEALKLLQKGILSEAEDSLKKATESLNNLKTDLSFDDPQITKNPPTTLDEFTQAKAELDPLIKNATTQPTNTDQQRCAVANQYKKIMNLIDIVAIASIASTTPDETNKLATQKKELERQKEELSKKYTNLLELISDSNSLAEGLKDEWKTTRKAILDKLPARTEAERFRRGVLLAQVNKTPPLTTELINNQILPQTPPAEPDLKFRDLLKDLRVTEESSGTSLTVDQLNPISEALLKIKEPREQHIRNLYDLATEYDKLPATTALSTSTETQALRDKAKELLKKLDENLKKLATDSLSTDQPRLPYTNPLGYRQVEANFEFAENNLGTFIHPNFSILATAYSTGLGNAFTTKLPPDLTQDIVDNHKSLIEASLKQLNLARSLYSKEQPMDLDKRIVSLQKKLEFLAKMSLQLEYFKKAEQIQIDDKKAAKDLKEEYDKKIIDSTEIPHQETKVNSGTSELTDLPEVSRLSSSEEIDQAFQAAQSKPSGSNGNPPLLFWYQRRTLARISELIKGSKTNPEELPKLKQLKLKLERQYASHLSTLRKPPIILGKPTEVAAWLTAVGKGFSNPLEIGLNKYFDRDHIIKLQSELLTLYKEENWLPPHFEPRDPPSLTLSSSPEEQKQQIKEIRADLEAKRQILKSITNKKDAAFTECAKLLKAQYQILTEACKAAGAPPPTPASPPGPVSPSPAASTGAAASTGSPSPNAAAASSSYLTETLGELSKILEHFFEELEAPFSIAPK